MKERRKYVRSDGLVLVNFKIPKVEMEGKSSVYNISGAGVRITVEKKIEKGTPIEMEIYLPGSSQPILAKGEIVWFEKYKEKIKMQPTSEKEYFYAGVKFTVIDEDSKNRISGYIHRKLHQSE